MAWSDAGDPRSDRQRIKDAKAQERQIRNDAASARAAEKRAKAEAKVIVTRGGRA